jgi:hypothetical protein
MPSRAARRASALILAAVIASLVAAQRSPTSGFERVPARAKVFVAPNGSDAGRCTRSSPCASFARAYRVAKPRQIVCVAAGSYDRQTIPYVAGRTTPNVIFQSCGGTATVLAVAVGANNGRKQPCCVTFRDLTITGSSSANAVFVYWGSAQASSAAHDVIFDNTRLAVGRATPGPVVEAYGTRRLTIKNSTIGPACCGNNGSGNAAGSPVGIRLAVADKNFPLTRDAVIDHNLIRGITRKCAYWLAGYGACPQSSCTNEELCHADAIQIWGATNTTITRNRVYNNEIQAVFFDPTAPLTNGRVENNLIGDVIDGSCGICFDGRGTHGKWTIRSNTLQGTAQIQVVNVAALPSGTRFAITGNLGNILTSAQITGTDCYSGAPNTFIYAYNVWAGAGSSSRNCGATDVAARPTFVNADRAPQATMDLRLARGSAGISRGDPTQGPTRDFEGDMRPLRVRADAGADQRESALLAPGRSIGALRIGAAREEVEAFYGRPRKLAIWRPAGAKPSDGAEPARIAYYRVHGGRLWVIYVSDIVVGGGTTSPFYSTASGLGVGAETARVARGRWVECLQAYRSSRGGVATFYSPSARKKPGKILSISMLRTSHEYC